MDSLNWKDWAKVAILDYKTMENSAFLSLKVKDFGRGLLVAVLASVFTVLTGALQSPDFSFSSFDWGEVGKIAIATAVAYLSKNLLSDESGKFLGKI